MPMSIPDTPFDLLAKELGAFAARIERELTLRLVAAVADLARKEAELDRRTVEFESRFSALERAVQDRIASVKDGRDGIEGNAGRDGVDGTPGRDGVDAAPGRAGIDGRDADPELIRQMIGEAVAALPPAEHGPEGPPGKLPIAKAWTDHIHYEGSVVTHEGSTYQAQWDTGRAPPHDDWICLARAGADGASFKICGTWDTNKQYKTLNVVILNGGAFVAKWDNPGSCPGDGWQMMASQGKQGKPGEPGKIGPKGDNVKDAAEVV